MQISQRFLSVFAAGAEVFAEGEIGAEMFVVIHGRVGVFRRLDDGGEAMLAVLGPGQVFGEMALVEAQPRSASVRALADGASLVTIDQPRFVYLLSHQPAFALSVMQAISQRLRSATRGTEIPGAGDPDDTPLSDAPAAQAARIHEIGPHVSQIELPHRASHVYLLRGRTKNVLIDCGLPGTADALAAGLRTLGLGAADIHMVVLTHEHIDHAGGAPSFAGHAMIAAHRLAANKVSVQDEFVLLNRAFNVPVEDFCVDLQLDHGSVLNLGTLSLQVIHTPGHTSGSICLYEPGQRLLFGGDALFAGGVMGGVFGSGNISDYIGSLRQLRNLRLEAILPGHGRPSRDPYPDLDRAIELATQLLADSKAFLGALNTRTSFAQVLKGAFGLKD